MIIYKNRLYLPKKDISSHIIIKKYYKSLIPALPECHPSSWESCLYPTTKGATAASIVARGVERP